MSEIKSETAEAPKDTIVIAEDSKPNLRILEHLVIKLGFNVVACTNGLEAWTKLNSGEIVNPTCVLSDVMMPEENGITLLKRLRESEKFKSIPFVFITAVANKELITEAKLLGVSGYILKPVSFPKVLKKLQEIYPERKFPKLAA